MFDLIRTLPPFEAPIYPPRQKPVLVWTDAMFSRYDGTRLDTPEDGCEAAIGAIVWCPRKECYFYSRLEIADDTLRWLFSIKHQYIAQLEMLAVLSLYQSLPEVLEGQLVVHWVDNQGVLWNATHGSAREPGCAALTHLTSLQQAALRCRVWYEYVASKANPADAPSRGDFSFVAEWDCLCFDRPFVWFESTFNVGDVGLW